MNRTVKCYYLSSCCSPSLSLIFSCPCGVSSFCVHSRPLKLQKCLTLQSRCRCCQRSYRKLVLSSETCFLSAALCWVWELCANDTNGMNTSIRLVLITRVKRGVTDTNLHSADWVMQKSPWSGYSWDFLSGSAGTCGPASGPPPVSPAQRCAPVCSPACTAAWWWSAAPAGADFLHVSRLQEDETAGWRALKLHYAQVFLFQKWTEQQHQSSLEF